MIRKIVRICLTFFLIVACFFVSDAASYAATEGSFNPHNSGTLLAYSIVHRFYPSGHDNDPVWQSGSTTTTTMTLPSGNPVWGATTGVETINATTSLTVGGSGSGHQLAIKLFCKGSGSGRVGSGTTNWSIQSVTGNQPVTTSVTGCSSFGGFDSIDVYPDAQFGTAAVTTIYADGNPNQPVITQDPPPVVTAGACSLSDSQLVMLARSAGWTTDAQLQTATAIAIAESKGVVNALHFNPPNPGSYDIGLWQINDDAHTSYTPVTLGTNPLYNASAAHDIYVAASNAWTPWATFNSGAYLKYMTRASQALQVAGTGVYPTINCSGALGNPDDPLYNQDPKDATTGQCTGWNPLTYIKCALEWAFVPDDSAFNSWQDQIAEMESKPPISWCIGGVAFVQAIFAEFNGDTPSSAPGWHTDFSAPGPHGTSIAWDPFQAASVIGATDSNWAYVKFALEMGMWLGLFLWVWKRARASFGGKSAT